MDTSVPQSTPTHKPGLRRVAGGIPRRWLQLTSCGWEQPAVSWRDREMRRRSQFVSWIILTLLVIEVGLIPNTFDDVGSVIALSCAVVATLVAAMLNRTGHISSAGILLTLMLMSAVIISVTPEGETPGGGLDLDVPTIYCLLIIPLLVAMSTLRPVAGFVVAASNIVAMFADFLLQAHTPYVEAQYLAYYGGDISGTFVLLSKPAMLQVFTVVVTYLLVRGVQFASVQAERAKQTSELQRRLAEVHGHQLSLMYTFAEQVQESLQAGAHGQFEEIVLAEDHPLYQVGARLNDTLRSYFLLKHPHLAGRPIDAASLMAFSPEQPHTKEKE